MSYLVLARKWRPQTFTDLVGQEHVAQTLQNAIAQGRVAHAFLFTGARGVGKTTIARVLAKALNCLNAPGPTASPCGTCAACTEIAQSRDVDVREIDGASNNSVENVRELQESLPYLPTRDRYKVVIIDEVHMLSTGAFNALLKTLEEPPPHVKFIFATTEVHKVPVTILSRCQRYDFKLLPAQRVRERVEYILQQEKIEHDDAAVSLVAREAAGSMRDALSLLDQVIAGATGPLTGAEAARLVGVADRRVLYDLARQVLGGDAPGALETLRTIADEGFDLPTVSRNFLSLLRDLVVARVVPDPTALLDLADDERTDVETIARAHDAADLERLFMAFSRTVDEVARAREPRWVMEMSLVRLAHRPPLVPIDEIVARLADLERRLAGDPKGAPPAGGGGGGGGARQGASAVSASAVSASAVSASAGAPSSRTTQSAPNTTAATRVPPAIAQVQSRIAAAASASAPATASATAVAPGVRAVPETKAVAVAPSVPVSTVSTAGAEALLDAWGALLATMTAGPITILKNAVPREVTAERVTIVFETQSFYARKAVGGEVEALLGDAAEQHFGVRPAVTIETVAHMPDDAPTIAKREAAAKSAEIARREQVARSHPFVTEFLGVFGGEIRGVKLPPDEN